MAPSIFSKHAQIIYMIFKCMRESEQNSKIKGNYVDKTLYQY